LVSRHNWLGSILTTDLKKAMHAKEWKEDRGEGESLKYILSEKRQNKKPKQEVRNITGCKCSRGQRKNRLPKPPKPPKIYKSTEVFYHR
jgi:hypothetical protein